MNYQPYYPLVPGTISTLKWAGIVPPETSSKIVETLRQLVNKKSIPWAILTCWGFLDSPVSWNEFEHGFLFSGENDYSFVILPEDRYYNLLSIGPLDAYT
jgi:ribonuclease P/MRP protein subunit RPP40